MDSNQQFINYHQTLMKLCHSKEFIQDTRRNKLTTLTALCSELLGVGRVSVWWLQNGGEGIESEILYHQGDGHRYEPIFLARQGNPAYFEALMQARVIDASDARQDPRTRAFNDHYLQPTGIYAMLDAPIFDDGQLSGVICLEALQPREWSLADISLATAVADTISLINTHEAWSQSQQQLDYVTHFDDLTGLPNLNSLRGRLHRLTLDDAPFALLWIDLDRIKAINDGMGQVIGNQIIGEVANRLRHLSIPGKDKIARVGGDEFLMVIRRQADPEALRQLTQSILTTLSTPMQLHDQWVSTTASVGISFWPVDGQDSDSLLKHAEAAMYHAKENGRNQVQFFNSSISADARSRFQLESQLRQAIRNQELDVHYQPIIRAGDSGLVQLEALVRWNHPTHGLLPPVRFLDLARSAGLMAELGMAVMRRACEHIRQAQQAGMQLPQMAINLAPEQLLDPQLPERLKEVYEAYGLSGQCFDFEITEDVIKADTENLRGLLKQLVELGAGLSIDDFGTGYSSLARLKHLPFAKLKIDRSFVKELPTDSDDCAITLSILGLARGLGMAVVAEGVETEDQERWLTEQGCDYLQGYRYSRPVPFDQLMMTVLKAAG
ncbi:putative bifunctional diguanylate cyclase/phosphodiesterase [Saccharospirillum mangrovi]|uniref:putative bifunctional diguanylate cyclase/phosphodiesterase n=1 Tax=Saccharospirillum mangrovi TaxID=2161747 RepID=UPI000D38AB1F|nr:sensor domain-containing phosphodiesterase [Saccharospirillum mangrovi]